jgi:DNA-binding Lrp family transcriptional regulator
VFIELVTPRGYDGSTLPGRGGFMITAFVLFRASKGKIPSLAQELLNIKEVAEVYSVAGEYDLIAILRVKAYDDMAEVVPEKLQALNDVERTQTLMAFQCYSRHDLERLFSIGYDEEITELA